MNKIKTIHKKFVAAYIKSLDPVNAAIEAGFSQKTVHLTVENLMKDSDIIKLIDRQIELQRQNLCVSKAYIIKKLIHIIEYALCAEGFDNSEQGYNFKDVQIALKAIENLCRIMNMQTYDKSSLNKGDDLPQIAIIDNLNEDKV